MKAPPTIKLIAMVMPKIKGLIFGEVRGKFLVTVKHYFHGMLMIRGYTGVSVSDLVLSGKSLFGDTNYEQRSKSENLRRNRVCFEPFNMKGRERDEAVVHAINGAMIALHVVGMNAEFEHLSKVANFLIATRGYSEIERLAKGES